MKPSMLRFAIGILIGLHIGKFGCKIYQEQVSCDSDAINSFQLCK